MLSAKHIQYCKECQPHAQGQLSLEEMVCKGMGALDAVTHTYQAWVP